jgi:hypothetical protein
VVAEKALDVVPSDFAQYSGSCSDRVPAQILK